MVRSLLVVLVLVLIVVALNIQPEPENEVRRFDYTVALEQARDSAPYDVLAPVGLPSRLAGHQRPHAEQRRRSSPGTSAS